MHERISVSAICSAQLSLEQDIRFWAEHGVARVGASVAKMEAHGWVDAVSRLTAAPSQIANVIGPGPFTLADPTQWSAQRERAHRIVDAAAALRASTIVFTTGRAGELEWEAAASAFVESTESTVKRAQSASVGVTLEHTNSLRVDVGFVHTLRDAIDLARRVGCGVCMEINACWAERDVLDTIRSGIDAIAIVQISDFAVGTLCTPDRLVPGDGDIPIEPIVQALLDAGYTGMFDLETIGPRIEAEGYDHAIPRSIAWLTDLLDRLAA